MGSQNLKCHHSVSWHSLPHMLCCLLKTMPCLLVLNLNNAYIRNGWLANAAYFLFERTVAQNLEKLKRSPSIPFIELLPSNIWGFGSVHIATFKRTINIREYLYAGRIWDRHKKLHICSCNQTHRLNAVCTVQNIQNILSKVNHSSP